MFHLVNVNAKLWKWFFNYLSDILRTKKSKHKSKLVANIIKCKYCFSGCAVCMVTVMKEGIIIYFLCVCSSSTEICHVGTRRASNGPKDRCSFHVSTLLMHRIYENQQRACSRKKEKWCKVNKSIKSKAVFPACTGPLVNESVQKRARLTEPRYFSRETNLPLLFTTLNV